MATLGMLQQAVNLSSGGFNFLSPPHLEGLMNYPDDNSGPIDVALQRPTIDAREGSDVLDEAVNSADRPSMMSKHGKFGPRVVTHPGLEM
jgi:hypothetical protein